MLRNIVFSAEVHFMLKLDMAQGGAAGFWGRVAGGNATAGECGQ